MHVRDWTVGDVAPFGGPCRSPYSRTGRRPSAAVASGRDLDPGFGARGHGRPPTAASSQGSKAWASWRARRLISALVASTQRQIKSGLRPIMRVAAAHRAALDRFEEEAVGPRPSASLSIAETGVSRSAISRRPQRPAAGRLPIVRRAKSRRNRAGLSRHDTRSPRSSLSIAATGRYVTLVVLADRAVQLRSSEVHRGYALSSWSRMAIPSIWPSESGVERVRHPAAMTSFSRKTVYGISTCRRYPSPTSPCRPHVVNMASVTVGETCGRQHRCSVAFDFPAGASTSAGQWSSARSS